MKKLSLLLALLLAGCTGPSVRAPWRSYRGALVKDKCQPFAIDAQADLLCRGVNAFYVSYSWSTFGGETGRHAVVLFQSAGRWYLMDNTLYGPLRVRGETVLTLVKCYDHNAYIVWQSDIPMPLNWF